MSLVYAVPEYVSKHKDDLAKTPPGHRFLLYFQACGAAWSDLKDSKYVALKNITTKGTFEEKFAHNLAKRQRAAATTDSHLMVCAKNTAPIATGLGNPHPVENGFAFLSPYGIPYLAGSSVKGVVRRAAEELALLVPDSGWTIPLVWVLFGFDEKSAYIDPINKAEPEPLQGERERMRTAFADWINSSATSDKLLAEWLCIIRSQFPKDKQELADNSALFCTAVQDERGREVRCSIHWQGTVNFWDVFPETTNGLAVDILNPHHKNYYEGKSTPNDAETPKPVFFLTIPPESPCTFICEMPIVTVEKRRKVLDAVGDWKTLMTKAYEHAFNWLGFGAKTSVGYGALERDSEAERRVMEEADRRDRESEDARMKEAETKKEYERLAAMSPLDRSIEEVLKNDPDPNKKPWMKLLDALKSSHWSGEEVRLVAALIRDRMKTEGEWRENPDPVKAKKDKAVKRTLEVMKYTE